MTVKGAVMVPHPPLIIPEVGRGQEKIIKATTEDFASVLSIFSATKEIRILQSVKWRYAEFSSLI